MTTPLSSPIAGGLVVVTPVFNDWASCRRLLVDLDGVASELRQPLEVVIVDDGSTAPPVFEPELLEKLENIERIDIVHLVINSGHARALAVGLAFVARERRGEAVVVMDCDGEDRPEDLLRLVEAVRRAPNHVAVAHRGRRSEGLAFRVCYLVYRSLFRILTGRMISFGNFCAIPWKILTRLVFVPDLFNHVAATLVRTRFPLVRVPTARGKRYEGRSKMNVYSLVELGLGAIAVDLRRVLLRILVALGAFMGVLVLGMATVAGIRLATDLAIPGWASNVFGVLSILLVQSTVFAALLLFIDLKNRTVSILVPALAYREFVADVVSVKE